MISPQAAETVAPSAQTSESLPLGDSKTRVRGADPLGLIGGGVFGGFVRGGEYTAQVAA